MLYYFILAAAVVFFGYAVYSVSANAVRCKKVRRDTLAILAAILVAVVGLQVISTL